MARKFDGSELVVASHNKGKLVELKELFGEKVKKLYTASDFDLDSPAETGTTFVENALIKAQYVAKMTGKVAIADDSGLCVAALDGAPGVYTADWAELPEGKRDFNIAMKKVEEDVKARWGDNYPKAAHFVCCLALAWPDGHFEIVEGTVFGEISFPMRGDNGFGYDPIFVANAYPGQTYGEMDPKVKNNTNHRADAFRQLLKKCF